MRSRQQTLPPGDANGNLLRKINEADARWLTVPRWHSPRETARPIRPSATQVSRNHLTHLNCPQQRSHLEYRLIRTHDLSLLGALTLTLRRAAA
jgi:hypothetical protein